MSLPVTNPQSQPLLTPSPPPYYSNPAPYLDPHPPTTSYFVLLPVRLRRRLSRQGCCWRRCLRPSVLLLPLLLIAGFLIWPGDPALRVARFRLDNIAVAARPAVAITVSTGLKVEVRNPNIFAFDYHSLNVTVAYRGSRLGSVDSGGGSVRANGVSYIDAELRLDGIRVVADAIYLLEDLARGSIPFDTVAEVEGQLRLFFFSVPVKGRISCSVNVNPLNQTIVQQDCYPE